MAEIWRYRGLIGNFTSRELKSKYKHSVLGWAWSLINPAATLLVYSIVFSTIFRARNSSSPIRRCRTSIAAGSTR